MGSLRQHLIKTRLFEWYARTAWNLHRLTLKGRLSRRCSRCAISERCSALDQGICSDCQLDDEGQGTLAVAMRRDQEQVAALDALLRDHYQRGRRQHDALLLLSGGKDSALLAHRLKTEYQGLRLLALTVDNGFLSPIALRNARSIAARLELEHLVFHPPKSLHRKGFRFTLKHLGASGCSGCVDQLDGELSHDIGRNVAAMHEIPLMISGVSREQVERLIGATSFEMPREIELQPRQTTGGKPLDLIYDGPELRYWWDPRRFDAERVPRVIFPFHAWNPDEETIHHEVRRLGLLGRGSDSPLVTNNRLVPLMGFVDVHKLGYSSFEPEFAAMIRQGQADRRLWRNIFEMCEHAAETNWLIGKEVDAVLDELSLSRADVGIATAGGAVR